MINTPLAFLEVDEEAIPAHARELGEPGFGEAPEALAAVDVVLAPGKLVGLMEDAVVAKAARDQTIVGAPASGVNVVLI